MMMLLLALASGGPAAGLAFFGGGGGGWSGGLGPRLLFLEKRSLGGQEIVLAVGVPVLIGTGGHGRSCMNNQTTKNATKCWLMSAKLGPENVTECWLS